MTGFDSKRQMAADKLHWSDCAVHNGPAYPAGECNCGVAQKSCQWIWLSDADIRETINSICQYSGDYDEFLCKKIEQKIKELNT